VLGHQNFSATGSPGTGPTIGGESNLTVCPGKNGPRNAIGTYMGPGGSLGAAAGGNGSAIGYRSTVTVGGPGC
jgi:hypothetical protein